MNKKQIASKSIMETHDLVDEDRYVGYKRILSKYQHSKNKHVIAAVYGHIFTYSMFGERQQFERSKEWLADELYVDISVIKDIIKLLLKDKLIADVTPAEYVSKTQVRYYKIDIQAFKNIKIDPRTTNKMTDEKKEEMLRKRKEKKDQVNQDAFEAWAKETPALVEIPENDSVSGEEVEVEEDYFFQ